MATTQRTSPITLTVTEQAAVEVRKFMAEEKASPDTAGLRIAVLPGGCSVLCRRIQRPILERCHPELQEQLPGIGVHLREPERHGRLRLRIILHGLRPLAPFWSAFQARVRRGLFAAPHRR